MNTPIRHFRIENEHWEALGRIGKELERPHSWLIRKAVLEYVERYKAARRKDRQQTAIKPESA